MLKRILTLFAILTGLAAVAAPAQARFSVIEDVTVHAAGETIAKCADRRIDEQAKPIERLAERKGQAPSACRPPVVTVVIPTVMLQADRTRE